MRPTLIRNVENQNELGTSASHIRTYILDIRGFDSDINWNVTKSFVVHVAEGIGDRRALASGISDPETKRLIEGGNGRDTWDGLR